MTTLVYAAVMLEEERDETGRLVYAPTSNYSRKMREAFPGPRRARPRANNDAGVTPPVSLQSGWPQSGADR